MAYRLLENTQLLIMPSAERTGFISNISQKLSQKQSKNNI